MRFPGFSELQRLPLHGSSRKKGMAHSNEVIHPTSDLPTNLPGERFDHLPTWKQVRLHRGFAFLPPFPSKDPLLKHTVVNKVEDIAHRREATNLVVTNWTVRFILDKVHQNLSNSSQSL